MKHKFLNKDYPKRVFCSKVSHMEGASLVNFQLEAGYGIVRVVYRWEELPDCGTGGEVAEEQYRQHTYI